VFITHAGGDVLDESTTSTQLSVDGNSSVWALSDPKNEPGANLRPQPDFRAALGSNEPVEFSSGETWRVSAHGGSEAEDNCCPGAANAVIPGDQHIDGTSQYGVVFAYDTKLLVTGSPNGNAVAAPLDPGEDVNVVWRASSGGKTQTLFKYTVQ
jgi:hypothetical protein